MKYMHVVGARPNFMKVGPVIDGLRNKENVCQVLVHTGQHYDANMSDIFFKQLGLPQPDVNLEIGSSSHARQTAQIMVAMEQVVLEQQPDWVVVYGDVNSTVAAAMVCAKLSVPLAHVEAGLRSFDRTMPEEINRVVTDQLANRLFTPSFDGDENLRREGVAAEQIHCVGNVMIDTLVRLLPQAEALWHEGTFPLGGRTLQPGGYALVTLHRPANVDDPAALAPIMETLREISRELPVVFPIHPRTRKQLQTLPGWSSNGRDRNENLHLIDPIGYLSFLALQRHALVVVTDSGGVQEETTFLQVPCLTLRPSTERPVTVTVGTNQIVGNDMLLLKQSIGRILIGDAKRGDIPVLWDGLAGERIARVLTAAESQCR